jgi:hypothetical protein
MFEKQSAGVLGCVFVSALGLSPACRAAPPWYISAQGDAQTSAAILGPPSFNEVFDDHRFDTGPFLQQQSFTGNTFALSRGDLTNPDPPPDSTIIDGRQASDSQLMGTATLGALHGVTGADSTISDIFSFRTSGEAVLMESWADQLTFHTSNPLGVDYTISLTMNDSLSTSMSPDSQGIYSEGDAQAVANTSLGIYAGGFNPISTLFLQDHFLEQGANSTDLPVLTEETSPSRTVTTTLHVFDGTSLTFVQLMTLQANATYSNGTAGANAADTAYFDISTSDPGASYTAASGTIYATQGDPSVPAVPEPSELALMLAGFGALAFVGRRRLSTGPLFAWH